MDTQAFITAYGTIRNGTDMFYRHPLALGGRFIYSEGVKECADAGCHWLLDILATELMVPIAERAIVEVIAQDGKARIVARLADDAPPTLDKRIDLTDLPDGNWKFLVNNDGDGRVCILLTEY